MEKKKGFLGNLFGKGKTVEEPTHEILAAMIAASEKDASSQATLKEGMWFTGATHLEAEAKVANYEATNGMNFQTTIPQFLGGDRQPHSPVDTLGRAMRTNQIESEYVSKANTEGLKDYMLKFSPADAKLADEIAQRHNEMRNKEQVSGMSI
jgi:hypothetical protein